MNPNRRSRMVVTGDRDQYGSLSAQLHQQVKQEDGRWIDKRVFSINGSDLAEVVADLARISADVSSERRAKAAHRYQGNRDAAE